MEYLKKPKIRESLTNMRILIFLVPMFLASCTSDVPFNYIEGQTMGTTYHITLQSDKAANLQEGIDSILDRFNLVLSTYIDSSTISKFNKSDRGISYKIRGKDYFSEVYNISSDIYQKTGGAFDPTVMPLVNYYGFGYKPKKSLDINSATIDSLVSLVGYEKVQLKTTSDSITITKSNPGTELDYSSIAKGYGVDIVCDYLSNQGVNNYLVEIGGETRAQGKNPRGVIWSIGINVPDPEAPVSDYLFPIALKDKAVATSGNYRNFYISDSVTYVHIIDPITGMSRPSDILSATIVANTCAIADAYATACIVMGSEKSLELINSIDDVEACFILSENGNYKMLYSNGFKSIINE